MVRITQRHHDMIALTEIFTGIPGRTSSGGLDVHFGLSQQSLKT